jgi:O-antigen ligase
MLIIFKEIYPNYIIESAVVMLCLIYFIVAIYQKRKTDRYLFLTHLGVMLICYFSYIYTSSIYMSITLFLLIYIGFVMWVKPLMKGQRGMLTVTIPILLNLALSALIFIKGVQ